jgi:hypothetical protein
MYEAERRTSLPPVLDVSQRLLNRPNDNLEHSHSARGVRIDSVTAGHERTHYHRTGTGVSEPAPNRPGHRHRLPDGTWTNPSVERWTSAGISRL